MNPRTGVSGTWANGASTTKIATVAAIIATASRRSALSGGKSDRKTVVRLRGPTSSEAIVMAPAPAIVHEVFTETVSSRLWMSRVFTRDYYSCLQLMV